MGFHEGNVSDRSQGEEVHTTHVLDRISCKQISVIETKQSCTRLTRWMDFIRAMSVIEIEQRKCTRLTHWMGFRAGNVSD